MHFEINSSFSTVLGYRKSVEPKKKKNIFRETGLPIRGQKLGHWFENRNFFVKQIGWSSQQGNMTSCCLRLAYFCGLVCLYSRWFCGHRNLEECVIWSCNTFWEEL